MLSEKMEKALNEQINAEFYSAYLYLSMSAYADSINLSGFAHWLRAQFQEEQSHALKLFHYVVERGGRVVLGAIGEPPTDFKSPLKLFEDVLAHERKVTGLINALYALAIQEKDYASQNAVQWFVGEQVEEEANAAQIVEQIKMVGDKGTPLFMLDRQLAAR